MIFIVDYKTCKRIRLANRTEMKGAVKPHYHFKTRVFSCPEAPSGKAFVPLMEGHDERHILRALAI